VEIEGGLGGDGPPGRALLGRPLLRAETGRVERCPVVAQGGGQVGRVPQAVLYPGEVLAGVVARRPGRPEVVDEGEVIRGIASLASRLSRADSNYAATGAFAAQRFAPIAPARQASIYVEDSVAAAERLGLRPADAGANIILAEPFDPVAFDRSTVRDELRVVAASQLAADLLTGPRREPSEGNDLLAWMRGNEDAWRT